MSSTNCHIELSVAHPVRDASLGRKYDIQPKTRHPVRDASLGRKFIVILLSVFLLYSCGSSDREPSDSKRFDWDLQGVWVSNDPSVYSGTLEIEYNRITIWDYLENQTSELGDDAMRPFREFTKGVALTGYSEEGFFFIRDAGEYQEGIPYTYYYTDGYPRIKFLRFTFGDRIEILRQVVD